MSNTKRNCSFTAKVMHGECKEHWHINFQWSFWIIASIGAVVLLIIGGFYSWVSSPEYLQEQQDWVNLERAGCNDIKYRMDEILTKQYRDRSTHEDRVLEYIQERYSWTCSPDGVGIT